MALTGGAAILARLRAQRSSKNVGSNDGSGESVVTVLYASQTGTAQEIARNIQAGAQKQGLKAKVMSFNECGFENINKEHTPMVVIVASSTGDGDPPDNAAKTLVSLRKKSNPVDLLSGVKFTVLGLGDSNYTRFMAVPRSFKKVFQDLGAQEFCKSVEADEVDGIEEIVEKWIEELWGPLVAAAKNKADGVWRENPEGAANGMSKLALDTGEMPLPQCRIKLVVEEISHKARSVLDEEQVHQMNGGVKGVKKRDAVGPRMLNPTRNEYLYRSPTGEYSNENPFWALVLDAQYLTSAQSDKKVIHLALETATSNIKYRPGDSIAIQVANSDQLVDGLLARLKQDGTTVFRIEPRFKDGTTAVVSHIKCPCSLRYAFKVYIDITFPPRKSLLRVLAEHCGGETQKAELMRLCHKDGREEYNKMFASAPNLLQLLNKYSSCNPPMDALLDVLPALAPRYYSITSAYQPFPDQIHIAFSLVNLETEWGPKAGVATNWLQRRCNFLLASGHGPSILLPIHHRAGGSFTAPDDLKKPWIMIGPGTGVAPFRGFLLYRRWLMKERGLSVSNVAPAWLFFGCRRRDEDFLYQNDLRAFEKEGVLSRLEVAFSREQEHKVYVQHLMLRSGRMLCDMLEDGAYVFVCGDGSQMAKDVHQALIDIMVKHGSAEVSEATQMLNDMARKGRYVRDIWS